MTSQLVREQFGSGAWRVVKWVVVGIVTVSGVVTVAALVMGDLRSALALGPLVLVVGALVVGFGPLTGWIRAWQVRRLDPNVRHPITQTLDEAGVHIALHTANIDLKWAGLYQVRETDDVFAFYYNRRSAYFLPKRCLGGSEGITALRTWIRERLPSEVPFIEQ